MALERRRPSLPQSQNQDEVVALQWGLCVQIREEVAGPSTFSGGFCEAADDLIQISLPRLFDIQVPCRLCRAPSAAWSVEGQWSRAGWGPDLSAGGHDLHNPAATGQGQTGEVSLCSGDPFEGQRVLHGGARRHRNLPARSPAASSFAVMQSWKICILGPRFLESF